MTHWTRLGLLTLTAAMLSTTAFSQSAWKAHDLDRPAPPVMQAPPQSLPVAAPSDAIVLFDGSDTSAWESVDGEETKWVIVDGVLESVAGAGYIQTKQHFGDVQLHVEWTAPVEVMGNSQGRGNSGVFLMSNYEVQVLDSYDNPTYPDGQASAIYGQYPPLVNVSRPPGDWQTYDIYFRRPRFNSAGGLDEPARITVVHNGILVQNNVEPWGNTGWLQSSGYTAHANRLPLQLQDHGNPVRFRNIWIRELPEDYGSPVAAYDMTNMDMDVETMDAYAGKYGNIQIVRVGNTMTLKNGDRNLPLLIQSKTRFNMKHTGGYVDFMLDEAGMPTEATWFMGGGVQKGKKEM